MTNETVMQDHPCKFDFNFPVDEWGRIGGLYSLADVPVRGYKIFNRTGTVQARDLDKELYEVKDDEKGWTLVVPMSDVELEEIK